MKVTDNELSRLATLVAKYKATSPAEPAVMNWGCSAECGGLGETFFSNEISAVRKE